jgi:hypothetical protein
LRPHLDGGVEREGSGGLVAHPLIRIARTTATWMVIAGLDPPDRCRNGDIDVLPC